MNKNYLLVVEYDGTKFSGWQKQPGQRTVQTEIEKAAKRISGAPAAAIAAGRTDKGVHALGQTVSLTLPKAVEPRKLLVALNAVLPDDVAVVSVRKCPAGFNARYKAKGKVYCYTIWNKPNRPVLLAPYSWHLMAPLDVRAMRKAARFLEGRHDFSAFDASGGGQENKVCTLSSISVALRDGKLTLSFKGDRFLYKMVRNMTGILVEVGRKKRKPEEVELVLRSRKRTLSGPTAPAQGLCLKKVLY